MTVTAGILISLWISVYLQQRSFTSGIASTIIDIPYWFSNQFRFQCIIEQLIVIPPLTCSLNTQILNYLQACCEMFESLKIRIFHTNVKKKSVLEQRFHKKLQGAPNQWYRFLRPKFVEKKKLLQTNVNIQARILLQPEMFY